MQKQNKLKSVLLFSMLMASQLLHGQDLIAIHSSLIPHPDSIWVFTPSAYTSNKGQLPAIYLLHGYSGSYRQWNDIIHLQPLADKYGFIIICPDGFSNAWYLNSPLEKDHQYARFFFEKLMPEINQRYHVDTDKVFVDGLSMGGYGALHLFITHPEKFLSAGAISGVVNLSGAGNHFGLPDLLGPLKTNQSIWKRYSVAGNLNKIASTGKTFIDDCGWGDPFFIMNEALRRECDSLGINGTFISRPGGHNAHYWRESLPVHFFLFNTLLKKKSR